MYLLGTNICIYALNGRSQPLLQKLLSIHPDEIAVSAITVMELEYGAAKSRWGEKTRQRLYAFLANYSILPFADYDAVVCGQIRAALARTGQSIGAYDTMIAAQGLARELTVVTHNTGEFARVQGLRIEDWAESVIR